MIDNIPYRNEDTILYMEDYTEGLEYCVISQPSFLLSDPEEQKNGQFVTLVYCYNQDNDCTENCLEYLFSDTEEEAEKMHDYLLDKWDNIQYSNPSEVADAEIQNW